MGNWYGSARGGSGAAYKAVVRITEGGTYTVVVGSGGIGRGGPKGANPSGTAGTDSYISLDDVRYVSAGGGKGTSGIYTSGAGGVLGEIIFEEIEVMVKSNGVTGASPNIGVISGHTWGAVGSSSGWANGGSASSSYHGYIKIVAK